MGGEDEIPVQLRRQLRADGTPGIGSGWLCDHAAVGEPIQLRLRRNDIIAAFTAHLRLAWQALENKK